MSVPSEKLTESTLKMRLTKSRGQIVRRAVKVLGSEFMGAKAERTLGNALDFLDSYVEDKKVPRKRQGNESGQRRVVRDLSG